MRLRSDHRNKIVAALSPFITGHGAKIFLFGSRTKDHLKGGDLDLALIIQDQVVYQSLKAKKHELLSALHRDLGERKIDIRLGLEENYLEDPFFQSIQSGMIEIYRWQT